MVIGFLLGAQLGSQLGSLLGALFCWWCASLNCFVLKDSARAMLKVLYCWGHHCHVSFTFPTLDFYLLCCVFCNNRLCFMFKSLFLYYALCFRMCSAMVFAFLYLWGLFYYGSALPRSQFDYRLFSALIYSVLCSAINYALLRYRLCSSLL